MNRVYKVNEWYIDLDNVSHVRVTQKPAHEKSINPTQHRADLPNIVKVIYEDSEGKIWVAYCHALDTVVKEDRVSFVLFQHKGWLEGVVDAVYEKRLLKEFDMANEKIFDANYIPVAYAIEKYPAYQVCEVVMKHQWWEWSGSEPDRLETSIWLSDFDLSESKLTMDATNFIVAWRRYIETEGEIK